MTKSIFKTIALAIISLLFISVISAVQDEKYYSFVELVNNSDLIVRGKVLSINSYEKEKGRIYSDIKFRVTKTYKGQFVENRDVSFTFLGGTIGDITTTVLEYPHFIKDQESILFLKVDSSVGSNQNRYRITGASQGKFNIYNSDKNKPVVVRDRFAANDIKINKGTSELYLSNVNSIPLTDFVSYLENYLTK